MGGKRVCLGKTFAEVTIRFTIPLIFYYLDFEFINVTEQTSKKLPYAISGVEELKLPMKVVIKTRL